MGIAKTVLEYWTIACSVQVQVLAQFVVLGSTCQVTSAINVQTPWQVVPFAIHHPFVWSATQAITWIQDVVCALLRFLAASFAKIKLNVLFVTQATTKMQDSAIFVQFRSKVVLIVPILAPASNVMLATILIQVHVPNVKILSKPVFCVLILPLVTTVKPVTSSTPPATVKVVRLC